MERQQNVRTAGNRRVGANFDFNGNQIMQNKGGGVVRFSGNIDTYSPCGHEAIRGVPVCVCQGL